MSERMLRNIYLCLDGVAFDYAINAFRHPKDWADTTFIDNVTDLTKDALLNEDYENCYLLISTPQDVLSFKLDSLEILPKITVTFPKSAPKIISRLKLVKAKHSLGKYFKKP